MTQIIVAAMLAPRLCLCHKYHIYLSLGIYERKDRLGCYHVPLTLDCVVLSGDDVLHAEPNVAATSCARARHDIGGRAVGDWLRCQLDTTEEPHRRSDRVATLHDDPTAMPESPRCDVLPVDYRATSVRPAYGEWPLFTQLHLNFVVDDRSFFVSGANLRCAPTEWYSCSVTYACLPPTAP